MGREGGRGVEYRYGGSDEVLEHLIGVEELGGEERVCLLGWEEVGKGEYQIVVEARSKIGGEWGRSEVLLSVVSSSFKKEKQSHSLPSTSSLKRQQQANCQQLWDNDLGDLDGIVTYPSGNIYFPAAMREEGVVIMVKGFVEGCEEVEMSKEIISENATLTWRFFLLPPFP